MIEQVLRRIYNWRRPERHVHPGGVAAAVRAEQWRHALFAQVPIIIGENCLEGGAGALVFLQKDKLSWLVTSNLVGIILVEYIAFDIEQFTGDLLKVLNN